MLNHSRNIHLILLQMPNSLDYHTRREMPLIYKFQDYIGNFHPLSQIFNYTTSRSILQCDPWEPFYRSKTHRNGEQLRTEFIPVIVSEDELKLIRTACKKEKVGIHAALQVACKQTMLEIVKENATDKEIEHLFAQKSPVKITSAKPHFENNNIADATENYVKPNNRNIFDHVTLTDLGIDFWSRVNREHIFMKTKNQESRFKDYLKCKHVDVGSLTKLPQSRRRYCLSFANLGNATFLDHEKCCKIKLTAHFLFDGQHKLGPALGNTFVTFNRKLYWTVTYFPPVTDRQLANDYVKRMMNILMKECSRK